MSRGEALWGRWPCDREGWQGCGEVEGEQYVDSGRSLNVKHQIHLDVGLVRSSDTCASLATLGVLLLVEMVAVSW